MPEKSAATVTVGCRIPMGLILRHPTSKVQIKLDGPRLVVADGRKLSPSFAITEVDADFWATWKAAYAKHPPLLSGAIFEAKNEQEAKAKGKELAKERTGFEQMSQRAMGVEKDAD